MLQPVVSSSSNLTYSTIWQMSSCKVRKQELRYWLQLLQLCVPELQLVFDELLLPCRRAGAEYANAFTLFGLHSCGADSLLH